MENQTFTHRQVGQEGYKPGIRFYILCGLALLGAVLMLAFSGSSHAQANEDKIAELQSQKTVLLKTLETQKQEQVKAIEVLKTVESQLKVTRESIKGIDAQISEKLNENVPADMQQEYYFFQ